MPWGDKINQWGQIAKPMGIFAPCQGCFEAKCVAKMAHCRPKTANRWLEVPDWTTGPLFFKNTAQKTLFGKPRPPWQVLLRNVQIAGNLAQNLSGTPVTQPQRDQYRGRVTGNTHGKMLKAPQHWHGGVACHGPWGVATLGLGHFSAIWGLGCPFQCFF